MHLDMVGFDAEVGLQPLQGKTLDQVEWEQGLNETKLLQLRAK